MKKLLVFLCLLSSFTYSDVQIRIIDTGPGLATVTRFDNDDILVYDTGHWTYATKVFSEFQSFIRSDDIDLLIMSHSDGDHISATDDLFNEYHVKKVIRTGDERPGRTNWENANAEIEKAESEGLTHDINLAEVNLAHGTKFYFGEATITYIVGYHESPEEWDLHDSEALNGISIVVRLEYKGNSVLFTGDAVGREQKHPPTAADAPAIATERYMIGNASVRPIESDILIAPHHGSDDASSQEFISAVNPSWVIFSAGHDYEHPRAATANRYLDLGYEPECLLRTDFGDNEGDDEWEYGETNINDPVGDDSIEITLPKNGGDPIVKYVGRQPIICHSLDSVGTSNPIVKKSQSGICHEESSSWYTLTRNFEPYNDLASCLDGGGRMPR